jgi:4-alpha-glucanotransferase
MDRRLGGMAIIAEDLGLITPEVERLRLNLGYPGMKILLFAFDGSPDNSYLPFNCEPDSVVYTGTHENVTTLGWWRAASSHDKAVARAYLGPAVDTEPHWTLITALSQSVANTLVLPFQDVVGLDGKHRMNTPGQPTGCWEWRFDWRQIDHRPAERLLAMTRAHGRIP